MTELPPFHASDLERAINPAKSDTHPLNYEVYLRTEAILYQDIIDECARALGAAINQPDVVANYVNHMRFVFSPLKSDGFLNRFTQWAIEQGYFSQAA